jgi:hypothetical protein
MTESARQASVVPITLLPHGNADSLSIVEVDGNSVVVNTEMWRGHSTAVFIPPETIVPTTRTEFAFLDRGRGEELICVKRLHGRLILKSVSNLYLASKKIGTFNEHLHTFVKKI